MNEYTPGPFDVGTTTLLAELYGIHNSIQHQMPNGCELRAAMWIEQLLAHRKMLSDALKRLLATTANSRDLMHEKGCRCTVHEALDALAKVSGRAPEGEQE